jgi:hypothetical protein
MKMKHDSRIYIAGHQGLVGSAILFKSKEEGIHPAPYQNS